MRPVSSSGGAPRPTSIRCLGGSLVVRSPRSLRSWRFSRCPRPPPRPSVTEFSTGLTLTNAPADITAGPDGKLWFTEQGLLPGVGSIDPATGDIDEYSTGLLNVPGDIVGGTDGGVWFTTQARQRVDRAHRPGHRRHRHARGADRLRRDGPRRRRRRQPLVRRGRQGQARPHGPPTASRHRVRRRPVRRRDAQGRGRRPRRLGLVHGRARRRHARRRARARSTASAASTPPTATSATSPRA